MRRHDLRLSHETNSTSSVQWDPCSHLFIVACSCRLQLKSVYKKGLCHIRIMVYIVTQNVDLEPFGKPPDLHHHIIMDLDLFGIHMHKYTIPNRSDSHLHAYLQII